MCSIFPSLLAELLVEQGDAFHDIFIIDQDGSKHSASRLVLAAHSDFFLALFTHSPKEQTTFDLNIVKRGSDTANYYTQSGSEWLSCSLLYTGPQTLLDLKYM